MSFIEDIIGTLAEKAEDLVERRGRDYFDDLIEEGDDQIENLPEEYRDEAREALDIVEGIKTPLLRLTNSGLARLLGHWKNGDEAEARRFYLTHTATYLERRKAIWAAGDKLVDNEDADEAAWKAVKEGLLKVGTLGIKFLGSMALKSLGIPVSL